MSERADYTSIAACRACGEPDLVLVLDLGMQVLSDFKPDNSPGVEAPLTLMRCEQCGLVQLAHTVTRDTMYTENYGFLSGVNEGIVKDLQSIVLDGLEFHQFGRWLDIASNDGTLLSFVPGSFMRVGFDPVKKFKPLAEKHGVIVDDYFRADLVSPTMQFDVITSVSMFYDIHDLDTFVREVKSVLAKDGVWIIQQNYLLDMLRLGAVDNICHEHLTYFSLNTLHRLLYKHGLEIIDASRSDVNGGVIRTTVAHGGRYDVQVRNLNTITHQESAFGLEQAGTYHWFADTARHNLECLSGFVNTIAAKGPVDVYGASTRGAVLWQGAGLDGNSLRQAVERQPEKVGKWFTPVRIPIVSEETMRADPPTALLVGPWWHRDAFIERERDYLSNGGMMIFPLPEVEVASK